MGKGGSRRRLPEDPLWVLPKLPEEAFPETFWKKCSFESYQTSSEVFRKTSSGYFPEEVVLPEGFRKKGSSGWTLKFPEELSGRSCSSGIVPEEPLLLEVCFFLNKNCFVFFLTKMNYYIFLLFCWFMLLW